MTLSFLPFEVGLRYNGGTSRLARRPGAGAVPGRRGACLAVRTPPAAFLCCRVRPLGADTPVLSQPPATMPTPTRHQGQVTAKLAGDQSGPGATGLAGAPE